MNNWLNWFSATAFKPASGRRDLNHRSPAPPPRGGARERCGKSCRPQAGFNAKQRHHSPLLIRSPLT